MALNFCTASVHSKHSPPFLVPKHKNLFLKLYSSTPPGRGNQLSSSIRATAESEGSKEDPPSFTGSLSSARTQLDLLEQLTSTSSSGDGYESDGRSQRPTVRDQLSQLVGDRDDDFNIPLGKNLKKVSEKFLTISQKRNIRRQAYLNEVSRRNDSIFFATIGAFVILPPLIILAVAVLTGYVELLP
ncbi:hypothetical protein HHK36_004972 [Tetracentron sinense]|uniref:Uncharacterized protein n=1 Tax=Tetracentron sinense TaxID=13715 RepID=A0A835DQP8_TETSI|nr:hypothetical protein HHK36_004972 [Tetracentron sinense]